MLKQIISSRMIHAELVSIHFLAKEPSVTSVGKKVYVENRMTKITGIVGAREIKDDL